MGTPNNKSKLEMKKGPWTRDEDQKLVAYIQQHGHGSWRTLPEKAGLERCGKSCRLRWTNYLRPDIKRGKFSSHEEKSIIRLHALLGNRFGLGELLKMSLESGYNSSPSNSSPSLGELIKTALQDMALGERFLTALNLQSGYQPLSKLLSLKSG